MLVRIFVLASVPDDRFADELASDRVSVEVFAGSAELLARLRRHRPDLVLLHHRPKEQAVVETVRGIRALSQVPCILRPMRADDAELRILSLEAGADDCVPASATPREVLARIWAILRRTAPQPAAPTNGWQLSPARRELFRPGGDPCQLTAAEFKLLERLVQSGHPVSRDELSLRILRRPYTPGDRAVDGLVARLLRKLDRDADSPVIKAVRGVGYAFVGFPVARPVATATEGLDCRKLPHNLRLKFTRLLNLK